MTQNEKYIVETNNSKIFQKNDDLSRLHNEVYTKTKNTKNNLSSATTTKEINKQKEIIPEAGGKALDRMKKLYTSHSMKEKYEKYISQISPIDKQLIIRQSGAIPSFEKRSTSIIGMVQEIPFIEDKEHKLSGSQAALCGPRKDKKGVAIWYKTGSSNVATFVHEISHYICKVDKTTISLFNGINVLGNIEDLLVKESYPLFKAIEAGKVYKQYSKNKNSDEYKYLMDTDERKSRLTAYRYELEDIANQEPKIDISKGITKEIILKQMKKAQNDNNAFTLPGILVNTSSIFNQEKRNVEIIYSLTDQQINILLDYLNDTNTSGLFLEESQKHLLVQQDKRIILEQQVG